MGQVKVTKRTAMYRISIFITIIFIIFLTGFSVSKRRQAVKQKGKALFPKVEACCSSGLPNRFGIPRLSDTLYQSRALTSVHKSSKVKKAE